MCIQTDVSISEFFYPLTSASAPKTAYQLGTSLFVSLFAPACCHLAAFAPQQNSTNSLASTCLAFCILFWSTSLFFQLFFFVCVCIFLSIISRPKSFFFKQTKNKEKQTSATPVCVFSFRGQTFSAVGSQSRGKCAASLEKDTQYIWYLTVQAMFMHVITSFDRNSTKPSASQSLISEVWKFYLVLSGKKTPLIFEFHHKNNRRITAPNLLQFVLSILFLFQLLLLEMTQMRKKKKEKILM